MKEQLRLTLARSGKQYLSRPGSLLIALAMAVFTFSASAQISVYIQQPESESGPLNFTWSETWGAPLDSASSTVVGNLVLVNDTSAGDTLACYELTNSAEMTGNIALLYRGTCEFGAKALNAQNAGAIGVVIVNNISGPPVGMGAGAVGDQVTIPVVMVSDLDGAYLRSMMDTTTVELRIGTLTGVFPYNMGLEPSGVLLPRAAAIPSELAMDATDLNFDLGAWVFNFGNTEQTNVTLQAEVLQDGTSIYNETSAPETVAPNDSVFISLPNFSQTSYSGLYTVNYAIITDQDDAFPGNDSLTTTLHIGDVFSYAEVDPTTGIPVADTYIAPAENPDGWRSCIYFSHPNASRVAATGLWVTAWAPADSVFEGNFITVQGNLWDAAITGPTDLPSSDGSDLSEEQYGDHILTEAERGVAIYVPFLEPLLLQDNANYLFCLVSNDPRTYHGYDDNLEYTENENTYLLPISNLESSGWFNGFTGFNTHPSIGVATMDATLIGIEENDRIEITPFPNPTVDQIKIPVAGASGAAMLEIFDMAGAKVAERQVNVGGEQVVVDMKGISNGTYMFNMLFEDGRRANFRVVVSR